MDLLQTVRKEGSRGGVDFKWEDVKSDAQRENYLGHSLMAPVGRWQKGKDLNWYAKAEDAHKTAEEREEEERERRKEERRKVKEAEEDAMARALGLPVPDRSANTEPLGQSKISQKDVNLALKEALDDGEEKVDATRDRGHRERKKHRSGDDRRRDRSRDRRRDRHDREGDRAERHRRRSRSRSRDREEGRKRLHRHRSRSLSREHRRHRSRSQERRRGEDRYRPRDHERDHERTKSPRREERRRSNRSRSRSRSPYQRSRPR